MDNCRFLLNIDVLGFGDLVDSVSLEEVKKVYINLVTNTAFAAGIISNDYDVTIYSDTIAIKSNQSNPFKELHHLIQISHMIQAGEYYRGINPHARFLPLRGTITYGEFAFHKGGIHRDLSATHRIEVKNINMIFGKAIIESYHFEKDIEMICIALADSAFCVTRDWFSKGWRNLIKSNLIVEYDIPLKKKKSKKGFIVNPISFSHCDSGIQRLKNERKNFTVRSSVHDKYCNTIKLLEYLKERGLFYPPSPE